MTIDTYVSFQDHKDSGNVWLVDVEIPTGELDENEYPIIEDISVEVIAPNQIFARFIAESMYSECLSITVPDNPM